jgi:hypothetical protein
MKSDFWTTVAFAGVINMEFKFTPYVGDSAKAKEVETVPGTALVFLNNVQVAEHAISKKKVPVLFEEREISSAVWVPASNLGPALRKGKNKIRFEFQPQDAKATYQAQLSWAQVTDVVTEKTKPDGYSATNQAGEGKETKNGKGKIVLEKEFTADFAADLAWHHYPAVTTVSDADKQKIAAMLKERAEAFKPKFDGVYRLLKNRPGIDEAGLRKGKVLEAAYTAGVRIAVPAPGDLEYLVTGNPEVIVRHKSGKLFPLDKQPFDRIKGDELQMGAGMALYMAYPPQMALVLTPAGAWEVVY